MPTPLGYGINVRQIPLAHVRISPLSGNAMKANSFSRLTTFNWSVHLSVHFLYALPNIEIFLFDDEASALIIILSLLLLLRMYCITFDDDCNLAV